MKKKVYGIGINDYDGKVTYLDEITGERKKIKAYETWKGMLERCYDKKSSAKRPTYDGCFVCDEWLSFSNFKEWFDKNYRPDLSEIGLKPCLDKDLLIKANKEYSPYNCLFIPFKINVFISVEYSNNTSGYVGVSFNKRNKKYMAYISDFETNKLKFLGYYTDPKIAGEVYKKSREIEALKARDFMKKLGYSENVLEKIK